MAIPKRHEKTATLPTMNIDVNVNNRIEQTKGKTKVEKFENFINQLIQQAETTQKNNQTPNNIEQEKNHHLNQLQEYRKKYTENQNTITELQNENFNLDIQINLTIQKINQTELQTILENDNDYLKLHQHWHTPIQKRTNQHDYGQITNTLLKNLSERYQTTIEEIIKILILTPPPTQTTDKMTIINKLPNSIEALQKSFKNIIKPFQKIATEKELQEKWTQHIKKQIKLQQEDNIYQTKITDEEIEQSYHIIKQTIE